MMTHNTCHQLEWCKCDSSSQGGRWGTPHLNPLEKTNCKVTPVGTPFNTARLFVEVEMCENGFAGYVDEKGAPFDVGGEKIGPVGTESATNNVLAVFNRKCG